MSQPTPQVTQLLQRMEDGDDRASTELFSLLYDELRSLARNRLRKEPDGITLQATDLVHEAWIKLIGRNQTSEDHGVSFQNRNHFFVAAANVMRQVLVDAARTRTRKKRGGGVRPRTLLESDQACLPEDDELLALNEALELLREEDPLKADLVSLRYFAGMTNAVAAQHIGVSVATAERYWAYARAWLRAKLSD